MMEQSSMIDFVVPWVDGSDPQWRALRDQYAPEGKKISEAQYRDWDIFKYWFRAVEAYAPWVDRIHLITCGQWPEWLNRAHPKLHCVDHRDYIPGEYLPTFSARPIELNIHRLEGLSEHFVYFNDDMFLNAPVQPEDFFREGKPCESTVLSQLAPSVTTDPFVHVLVNDITVINKHFKKHMVIRQAFTKWFAPQYGKYLLRNLYYCWPKGFSSLMNFHVPSAMRKSTFEEVWQLEPEILHNTCKNRFRGLNDVNQYVMSWYNICKGEFVPRKANFGKFYTIGADSDALHEDLLHHKHKMVCINDNPAGVDVAAEKEKLLCIFEKMLPNKSSFEL